jgi:hypothetical protein
MFVKKLNSINQTKLNEIAPNSKKKYISSIQLHIHDRTFLDSLGHILKANVIPVVVLLQARSYSQGSQILLQLAF